MHYTKEQIAAALMLYAKTGSPAKVTEMLGYPSVPMLYHWKVKFPELYGREPKKSWTLAPLELKLDAIHRCYEQGERIQSVAEDIGYTVHVKRSSSHMMSNKS